MYFETCPHCGESIRADRMDNHVKKYHETAHPCNRTPRHHFEQAERAMQHATRNARRWGDHGKSESRW